MKNSFLLKEFDNLFSSLFKDAETYVSLVRIIASVREGIPQEEIFRTSEKFTRGGTIKNKLRDLEDAGFIISFLPYHAHKKGIYYKVIDEYSLFYFQWIEPIRNTLLKKSLRKGYWQELQLTQSWKIWSGYAFEAICYKHINQISQALKLSPAAIASSWRYAPKKQSDEMGAQIDLLFDRNDHVITLCDIKYTTTPFIVDKDYARILINKAEVFKKVTRSSKNINFAIISANGIKKSIYSEDLISATVTLADLFQKED